MMSTDYLLPRLPLGGATLTILRWLKQPGQAIEPGEPLLIAANERVEVALPAPAAGTLDEILVAAGATADVGAVVARYSPRALATAPVDMQPGGAPRAMRITPLARRIAAIHQIDVQRLAGSGPGGWVMKRDVLAAVQGEGRPTTPDQQASTSTVRMSLAFPHLRASPSPAVAPVPCTLSAVGVDLTQVLAFQAQQAAAFARRGIELTHTACIACVAVAALLNQPLLNSTWSDAYIIRRRRVHLALTTLSADGPVTQMVPDAQDLNLRGLARALTEAARRAQDTPAQPERLADRTFTLISPGHAHVWGTLPAHDPRQGATLAIGTLQLRPTVITHRQADRIAMRPIILLTLACDARIVDQAVADAFLVQVKCALERFKS